MKDIVNRKRGRKKRQLSERQIAFIVENYNWMSDPEMAKALELQVQDVFKFRSKNTFERTIYLKRREPTEKMLRGFFDVDNYGRELISI